MDQNTKLVPADGRRPEDVFSGPMIRRLCICRYQCPLCLNNHEAHLYISFPAADLDEYVAQLKGPDFTRKTLEPTVVKATMDFHKNLGDLRELMEKVTRHGLPLTTASTLEITDESIYTCDECSRTFSSIGELRVHMAKCQ